MKKVFHSKTRNAEAADMASPVPTFVPPKGDPRFHALLKKAGDLHDKKQMDYGQHGDPFAGYVQPARAIGLSLWKSPFLRLNEKVIRLQNYGKLGGLVNEGPEDSFEDIAVLALICYILHEQEKAERAEKA